MTYGTSYLLIGGEYFQGEGQEKYCCVRGRGLYKKNKNIGGCILSTQPDQQTRPQYKNAQKKCKKLSNIEKKILARVAYTAFYKFHISGAANRHAPVQHAKYVVFFPFF